MRKFLVGLVMISMTLVGCRSNNTSDVENKQNSYRTYYERIETNTLFEESSVYFSIDGEVERLSNGSYRYNVVLDEPQMAMYDVVILAIEDDTPYINSEKMMPSIGIFDDTKYALIPYQSNTSAGYVKGLVLNGECTSDTVALKILVEWRNNTRDRTYQSYIEMSIGLDGIIDVNEEVEEDEQQ